MSRRAAGRFPAHLKAPPPPRDEGQHIHGTHVYAQPTQDASIHVQENVGEAPKTPRRLTSCLFLTEPGLYLAQSDPPTRRQCGHRKAVLTVVAIESSMKLVQHDHLTLRSALFSLTRKGLMDGGCRPTTVGDGIDQVARSGGGIAARPYPGHRGGQMVIGGNGVARRDLGTIGAESLEIDLLPDGEDDGVGIRRCGDRRGRNGGEPPLVVEHRRDTDRLQPDGSAILGGYSRRPPAMKEIYALHRGFLHLEHIRRHLRTGL